MKRACDREVEIWVVGWLIYVELHLIPFVLGRFCCSGKG